MDPTDIITNPAFGIVPGNTFHYLYISPDNSSAIATPGPAQPVAPPAPRMGTHELDDAIVDVAAQFADSATHPGNASRITSADINRQLGKAKPSTQKLLEMVLRDPSVWRAVRGAAANDGPLGLNASDVTTQDLAELKAEVQSGKGKALAELRSAVRVDGAR